MYLSFQPACVGVGGEQCCDEPRDVTAVKELWEAPFVGRFALVLLACLQTNWH